MTMIRLPPQPTESPRIHGLSKHYGSQKPLAHVANPPSGGQQQQYSAPQFPQQYAYPLPRSNSYQQNGTSAADARIASIQSENMLRRKTPNGILTGAYDGTTVEQSHATKHILLPASAPAASYGMGGGVKQELYTKSPRQSRPTDHFYGTTKNEVTCYQQNPPIDSVLNQMPMQAPPIQFTHGYNQFPSLIPPPFQNPLVPTISNDNGLYGPYWANGTYAPYRPAAMRDPRFQHGHANGLSYGPASIGNSQAQPHWQPYSGTVDRLDRRDDTQQQNHMGSSSVSYGLIPGGNSNLRPMSYQNDSPSQHSFFQEHSRSYGTSTTSNTFNTFSMRNPYPSSQTVSPLAEYGPNSDNGQLRERVFSWAHGIYVDLLKYLHQTRKFSHNMRQMHGQPQIPRPNFYPKPPRQPGSNFTSPMNNQRPVDTISQSTPPRIKSEAQSTQLHDRSNGTVFRHRPGLSHSRSSSLWSGSGTPHHEEPQRRYSWQSPSPHQQQQWSSGSFGQPQDRFKTLRRTSGATISHMHPAPSLRMTAIPPMTPLMQAINALDSLTTLCEESGWTWVEGMLLGGSLAYGLGDYQKALDWYSMILGIDANHVEAMSNLAATLLALGKRKEAHQYWSRAVHLRPSYFEAVEHLVGLLCGDHKGREAVEVIEFVEKSLRYNKKREPRNATEDQRSDRATSIATSPSIVSDRPYFEYEDGENDSTFSDPSASPGAKQPGFGSSGYAIPGIENGRILQLIHHKGNMLYALGDNVGAAKAFETAVLIGVGRRIDGIAGLIGLILTAVTREISEAPATYEEGIISHEPILLPPEVALRTARLCFPAYGDLPGLRYIPLESQAKKSAVLTTSNSLLSLAKIFQDGMAMNSPKASAYPTTCGVREILALYYLSLSLQPSPSTANNVGILLASVQQTAPPKQISSAAANNMPLIPGIVPGSGIALALAYYNYGLNLDQRHAHLYTNLGSLLKDIGQLDAAINMYESAVKCDPNFDIALANLANAVKDKGRIADAIMYYRRAVHASPDFAEAVCGLANALNSVCGWQGRGGIATDGGRRDMFHVDEKGRLMDARLPGAVSSGWIKRVVDLVEKQLADGEDWGHGLMNATVVDSMLGLLPVITADPSTLEDKERGLRKAVEQWTGNKWQGARLIRLVERVVRRLGWQWYQDKYVRKKSRPDVSYNRPKLPAGLTVPAAPTVLPFHTFTCPMSAKQVRQISQRNGLRISCSTLKAPWLPRTVFPPPPPPNPYLKVGYVSSDFNNHPLAHLMQSVFGLHDPTRIKAYCYATTASDSSIHRLQIEKEAPVFYDSSSWSAEHLVNQIVADGIHILVNLNGYTRGARNEVFAARPAPIQMSFMGFAGTLGAEWCDYLLADEMAVPPSTLRPWRRNIDLEDALVDETNGGDQDDWVYGENIIYCRDTFFCCDHRQSAPDATGEQLNWKDEQARRWAMRKEIFPTLPDDAIILGNFNQLYKIDPTTFRTWLRILAQTPKAVLWLLRFPDLGETHLRATAHAWAGAEVASRILFTDVAPKHQHISRARVCDLFLDTPECNAHTTAADVLWSGTPLLTFPRYEYKMCSRMAASILSGALPKGDEGEKAKRDLIVTSEEEYEAHAVSLAKGLEYNGHKPQGRLAELRKTLYENRWKSALFDTKRWVRDLEEACWIAWGRWEKGEGGDIWLE